MGVGYCAHVDTPFGYHLVDRDEFTSHDSLQSLMHFIFRPIQTCTVLDPLEMAHCSTASINQNIGHDERTIASEDLIGVSFRWAIRHFNDCVRDNAMSVVDCDLVFERCGMASVKIVSLSEAGITDSQFSSGTNNQLRSLDASNLSFLHAENLFFSEKNQFVRCVLGPLVIGGQEPILRQI